MDPEDAFCYCDQLPTDSIRLLYIIPDQSDAPLACRLRQFKFSPRANWKAVSYNTLSYAWGSQHKSASITCNGDILAITKNLHQALRRIRQLNSNAWWWVDALCINQDDSAEKNGQVRMMQEIYTRSQSLLAWLGEEEPSTEAVVDLISRLYDIITGPSTIAPRQPVNLDVEALGLPELHDPIWGEVYCMLARPWFRRIWIVQEIVTAPTGVFMIGHHVVSLSKLFTVAGVLNRAQNILDYLRFSTLRSDHILHGANAADILYHLRTVHAQGFKHQISFLVWLTTRFESSDPRDKIFALVGLSSDAPLDLIDYDQNVESISIAIMKIALTNPFDLDVLTQVCKSRKMPNWPSWVPTLTQKTVDFSPLSNAFRPIFLGPSGRPVVKFGPNNALYIQGKIIDDVHGTIDEMPYHSQIDDIISDENVFDTHNADMCSWMQKCEMLATEHQDYIDGTKSRDAFWKAFIFDTVDKQERTTDATRTLFEAFVTSLKMLVDGEYDLSQVEQRRREILSSGRAFRRDIVMVCAAGGYLTSIGGLLVMSRKSSWRQWSHALKTGMILLSALYALLLQCPYAITAQMEEIESLQQRMSKLNLVWQPIRPSLTLFPRQRKFFKSRHGTIGWVPETAINGDSICIFKGCRIPFVVRKLPVGYELLGDCYLQGLMHGEAWICSLAKVEDIILV